MRNTRTKTLSIEKNILRNFELFCAKKMYKESKIVSKLMVLFCEQGSEIFKKIENE